MEESGFQRALDLNLCLRCLSIFVNPKYERIVYSQDREILTYLSNHPNAKTAMAKKKDGCDLIETDLETICPCCLNFFHPLTLNKVLLMIQNTLNEKGEEMKRLTFSMTIHVPPILETLRIGIRTLVYQSVNKLAPSPSFEELYERFLCHHLQDCMEFVSHEKSDVKINIDLNFKDEEGLAVALDPQYRHCNKKRVLGAVSLGQPVDNFLVTRRDSENLLHAMKALCTESLDGFQVLTNRVLSYCNQARDSKRAENGNILSVDSSKESRVCLVDWQCRLALQPIYLLGRYRKYSRDISQALWTLGSNAEGVEDDGSGDDGGEDPPVVDPSDPESAKAERKRKGRGSVEEIIQEAVNRTLLSKSCRMHPCGREDIDVRMLGNGRPVVIEVLESQLIPNDILLNQIVQSINQSEGLNSERDIDLVCLSRVNKEVWTTMQTAAEEKNKAYMCVCWSEKPLTRQMLNSLESLPDTDEHGTPCLRLCQKTPIRVLHRRSLLSRERYLYEISACLLNEHYFLLNLITSAGTYVKEFVHGDLGRTTPSVTSLLQSNADILQLDVMWLFDSFEGNSSDAIDLTGDRTMYRTAEAEIVSWQSLRTLPLLATKKR